MINVSLLFWYVFDINHFGLYWNFINNRSRTTQHFRHRASPDCNTVASFDSSSSESRNGLNRYYRQAWENLHESASKNSNNHNALRRKETLDPPNLSRSKDNLSRSRDNLDRWVFQKKLKLKMKWGRNYWTWLSFHLQSYSWIQ